MVKKEHVEINVLIKYVEVLKDDDQTLDQVGFLEHYYMSKPN